MEKKESPLSRVFDISLGHSICLQNRKNRVYP